MLNYSLFHLRVYKKLYMRLNLLGLIALRLNTFEDLRAILQVHHFPHRKKNLRHPRNSFYLSNLLQLLLSPQFLYL